MRTRRRFAAALLLAALAAPSPVAAQPPLPPGAIQPIEMDREAAALEAGREALLEIVGPMESRQRELLLSTYTDIKRVTRAASAAGVKDSRLRSALAHYIVALKSAGAQKDASAVSHALAALELLGPLASELDAPLSSRTAPHAEIWKSSGGLRALVPEARAALANPKIDDVLRRLAAI